MRNICFEDEKQSFMTSWHVFLSNSNIFGQEIFSLDKFWFCGSTQKTFKPLVWDLFYQNILIINDFMKVYEKLIIFIKSLILNIFWWKKCLTIALKVFELIYKIRICLKLIFLAWKYLSQTYIIKENMRESNKILLPHHKTPGLSVIFYTSDFHLYFANWNIFIQEILILDKFWFHRSTQNTLKPIVRHFFHQNMLNISDFMKIINFS